MLMVFVLQGNHRSLQKDVFFKSNVQFKARKTFNESQLSTPQLATVDSFTHVDFNQR